MGSETTSSVRCVGAGCLLVGLAGCGQQADPPWEADSVANASDFRSGDDEVGNGVKLGHPDAMADLETWFKFLAKVWAFQASYESQLAAPGAQPATYAEGFLDAYPGLVDHVQTLPATDWLDAPIDPSAVYCDPFEDPTCGCTEPPGSAPTCPELPPPNPQTPWEECNRPPVPEISIQGCSPGRMIELREAYEYAHYMTWRLTQLVTHIRGVQESVGQDLAAERWGKADPNQFTPQFYWGEYDPTRVEAVHNTLNYVWQSYFVDDNSLNFACYDDVDFEDVVAPQLLAAKLASPCLYNFIPGVSTVANALYIGAPNLHPNYPEPTVEICDAFFSWSPDDDGRFHGSVILHELLHWLVNDIGMMRDKHDPCSGIGNGDKHCMSVDEIVALADTSPNHAVRNIYSYNEFAVAYGSLYFDGQCGGGKAICFDDWGICNEEEGAGSEGPPPVPEACDDTEPGTCEGGECAQIIHAPSMEQQLDIFSPAHPDGDFSEFGYCQGADMVCVNENGGGRCRTCGPGQRVGCPCDLDAQCADAGLVCWGGEAQGWSGGQGRCWEPIEGPPIFQCDEPCEGRSDHLGNNTYYCFHDLSIVDEATCLHMDCGEPHAFCATDDVQSVCKADECFDECEMDAHCGEAFGWPPGTVCGPDGCVLGP